MKKIIPFILSIIAIASITSVAVLGNTQTAYAGFVCQINPATLDLGTFATDVLEVPIGIKEISCGENITVVDIDTSDCDTKGVSVSFENQAINLGVWTADEIINGVTAPDGIEVHCDVIFDISNGADSVSQTIWLIPDDPDFEVGGEFLPINSTALVLAGLQSSAIWMLPVLAGVAGAGFYLIKFRMNKE